MTSPSTLERPLSGSARDDDPVFLRGPVLRTTLAVMAGLLVCLAAVLTLAALGVSITRSSTLLAVGGYALAVTAVLVVRRRREPRRHRASIPVRTVAGGLVSALVLLASIGVAVALQPTTVERFVSLQSTASGSYSNGSVSARAGEAVEIGWQLRGHGVELTATPRVDVTVDAAVPDDLVTTAGAEPTPAGGGSTSQVSGRVTFTAAAQSGRHVVVIRVSDAADPAGGQELVLQLEVTS